MRADGLIDTGALLALLDADEPYSFGVDKERF